MNEHPASRAMTKKEIAKLQKLIKSGGWRIAWEVESGYLVGDLLWLKLIPRQAPTVFKNGKESG